MGYDADMTAVQQARRSVLLLYLSAAALTIELVHLVVYAFDDGIAPSFAEAMAFGGHHSYFLVVFALTATALAAAAAGDLTGVAITGGDRAAVTVVVTAATYPEAPLQGARILGVDEAIAEGALVFHAGTALLDGNLVAAGGRILNVTGTGATIGEARETAYRAARRIELPGSRFRADIARAAAASAP